MDLDRHGPRSDPGHDEAAGHLQVSSGSSASVPVLRLSASGHSKWQFWGGTRGKESNTDTISNEPPHGVIPC
ncbi:hypothetical protein CHR55_05925 [Rhodococcus qingshengii]|uniref:Uncharacterized protein n=1 Tax=Rhodococcus qingshengii TaxID=334542 RepID=A0A2A5JEI5_RHOSG|nr:hypothetical protein CHR55_05925 [Rhodococcus qingshengii]